MHFVHNFWCIGKLGLLSSQGTGSASTCFKMWWKLVYMGFVGNCICFPTVREFLRSVIIWWTVRPSATSSSISEFKHSLKNFLSQQTSHSTNSRQFVQWVIRVHFYFTYLLYETYIITHTTSEVFNICHAVDPTEIPSSGGGPHGPRLTGFNLSYSWLGQNMSY